MPEHSLSAEILNAGLDRLAAIDPDVARALARIGYPEPRVRRPGFATLLRIMVAQQLSTRSAAAIWARVEQACPPLVTAERFLALARIGYPEPRVRRPGFATLLRIMVAQQLSTRSAAAIWARLEAACGPEVTAQRFLELGESAFKTIGFSRQKIVYGGALAEAIARGALDLEALATIPEEDAIEAISALRGFGRWSAEIYLLFALGRADVFPADDLGLQVGMQRLKRLDSRPNRKLMDQLAEPWRPVRGCGAIFLWHLYGTATLDDALIA